MSDYFLNGETSLKNRVFRVTNGSPFLGIKKSENLTTFLNQRELDWY
jgi:hypothetical protein